MPRPSFSTLLFLVFLPFFGTEPMTCALAAPNTARFVETRSVNPEAGALALIRPTAVLVSRTVPPASRIAFCALATLWASLASTVNSVAGPDSAGCADAAGTAPAESAPNNGTARAAARSLGLFTILLLGKAVPAPYRSDIVVTTAKRTLRNNRLLLREVTS